MIQKLDCVFTIDGNFIQHFTVACTSLLETNREIIGRVMIVHDMDFNKQLNKSFKYFLNKYNLNIESYKLQSDTLSKYKTSHHITKAAYFRLLLSEILPANVNRVLYLDSDLVINGSLSYINDIEFNKKSSIDKCKTGEGKKSFQYVDSDEYFFYATDHGYNAHDLARLDFANYKSEKYFNSGVMLINLKKWRASSVSEQLINIADKYNDHLTWWDQDILNIAFQNSWGELSYAYNAFCTTEKNGEKYKIIHYTGPSKPWHLMNRHPYKYLYWKYLRMTPFKYYFPIYSTFRKSIASLMPQQFRDFVKGMIKK